MLDKKSIVILKSLNKLSEGCTYKVTTSDEIISNLSQKSLYDHDNVKEILDYLEKQEFINIKFSEENTYCYSLLPKARIYLEQTKPSKRKTSNFTIKNYLVFAVICFVSSIIALIVFFYFMF